MSSQILLIAIEIALAIALYVMYHAARNAFSLDEARRAAIEEADRLAESIEVLARSIQESTDQTIEDLSRSIGRAEQVMSRLEAAADSARPLIVARSKRAEGRSRAAHVKNLRSAVLELAAQGMAPAAIAKETNTGVGEVELLLGLSRRPAPRPRGDLFAGSDVESSD